ncbi:hypothetical protein [Pseudomonas gingeri]|uniref:hypothetical protein n=1 Tax=Pseudomonas gingeri TaxID=117681 RepID=UPI0015A008AF|nr:hypothetical protein [Pseudomonas gingeri]NWD04069.1 hypothetical protein [Pseudomonas gingeri]NWE33867.1 hypothetical protein [Pseudomonas gingeri]NWE58047.1 hypothetical protein [Pseudomonas gingeri]NWF04406.1 hypothetical protein [Pseudomonas gingeri]
MTSTKKLISPLDTALAEFLRGKMRRLHASYTLAFEAGWNARNGTEIEQVVLPAIDPGSEEFSHLSTIELRGYHLGWAAAMRQSTNNAGKPIAQEQNGPDPMLCDFYLDREIDAAMGKAVKQ